MVRYSDLWMELTLSAVLPWLEAGLMVTRSCLLLDLQSPARITSQSVCGMVTSCFPKVKLLGAWMMQTSAKKAKACNNLQ